MAKPLRVLVVEDSEDDALLVIHELKRGGYDVTFKRVETAEAMTAALDKQAWDVIIADYHLPHFSAPEALELFHQSGLDLPFIVISGTIGEETAVGMMKDGAHDYLMKGNLKRLIPAVERELHEAETRKERKKAEEALHQSEEKLFTILENTSDVIFQLSPLGTIQYVSPRAVEIYGYKPEDLIGRHLKKTTPARELPKALKVLKSVLSGKVVSDFEINQIDANGRLVPVEINATPVKKDGKIIAVQGVIRNITQRKEAQDRIKHAAQEWRITFDSIADLISIHDKDFRLVRVNKAFADAVNMKPAELVGKTCYQVVHGTNECVPHCPHIKTLETGEPAIAECFEPHLGIYLEAATSPIFNEKGKVVASVHVARDITERKKMEAQLIATDRLASIGELSSGIAHELNNPLTSIIGFSQLLLDKNLSDDVKEDLELINREAQRTSSVVRNLLTFARKHKAEKQPVDVNGAIKLVLALRAYEQKVNNIQVNTHLAPDLTKIMADGFQLQQVFLNIIINAEHFMLEAHGKGTLTITTERVGDIIRACFTDDGPGIAKENLGHLFDPFFTTKKEGKGTGLGLSISYGIITEHGGKIYAESELGKGTTFVVELPIVTKVITR